ncbi:substrate-binding domain-containing protein [Burkholderia sp. BE17]|uniref:substrate-binding domain-containing protein n=1 Tax=Burkholderia sp. BE17 TaxID=2656644 RepID=UPI00187B1546|nr:substrate-binding domain-containing protein [Burkholderia sp. BE17]
MLLAGAASTLAIGARLTPCAGASPRLVFLNPGESVERASAKQRQLVSGFMAAAAKTLTLRLEVQYPGPDHLVMRRQAETLARVPSAPDYIVIVNEKRTPPRILRSLHGVRSTIVVTGNDLTEAQRREIDNEREQIAIWIVAVTADASSAGYRLMAYLVKRNNALRVIRIAGDPSSPVSQQRAVRSREGMDRPRMANLNQRSYRAWTFGDNHDKARVLLTRFPRTNAIGAANGAMTLGAKTACDALGLRAILGGMRALPEALRSLRSGGLTAMLAGDYFIGAFAMVLICDHHMGVDFATRGHARLKRDFLTLVDRGNAASYYALLFGGLGDPDFGTFSRVCRRTNADYDFSIEWLLATMSGASDVSY